MVLLHDEDGVVTHIGKAPPTGAKMPSKRQALLDLKLVKDHVLGKYPGPTPQTEVALERLRLFINLR